MTTRAASRRWLVLLLAPLLLAGCDGLWRVIPSHKDPADKAFVVGTWYWDYKSAGHGNLTMDDVQRIDFYGDDGFVWVSTVGGSDEDRVYFQKGHYSIGDGQLVLTDEFSGSVLKEDYSYDYDVLSFSGWEERVPYSQTWELERTFTDQLVIYNDSGGYMYSRWE